MYLYAEASRAALHASVDVKLDIVEPKHTPGKRLDMDLANVPAVSIVADTADTGKGPGKGRGQRRTPLRLVASVVMMG